MLNVVMLNVVILIVVAPLVDLNRRNGKNLFKFDDDFIKLFCSVIDNSRLKNYRLGNCDIQSGTNYLVLNETK
jgi:hypothetical protein